MLRFNFYFSQTSALTFNGRAWAQVEGQISSAGFTSAQVAAKFFCMRKVTPKFATPNRNSLLTLKTFLREIESR
ncbi:hypothetical protein WDM22_27020 [Bradyrhizobium septentrionale]|uniref:hypothetical protein n=1 Tax=Bradyrhizobium septentrionale TaxID=1404411 RepID=UPI0030CAA89F